MTVGQALRRLVTRPRTVLIKQWNWKSALLSSLVRGLIFFFVNLGAGLHAATGALIAEWCYRGLTSGFYGALTQVLSAAEPAWVSSLVALILLPLGSHSLEFGVHFLRHTPRLGTSILASLCFTAISTAFHLHAMRRGAFIVCRGASSLWEDMARVPYLIGSFVSAGPLMIFGGVRRFWALRFTANQEYSHKARTSESWWLASFWPLFSDQKSDKVLSNSQEGTHV